MADEKYKSVSTFALPDEYQRQASEARRRRRMAEMLAQQAYQPGDIQNAPIPRGAPLVQGLQAYLTARAARKADEAEEGAKTAGTKEARDFLRALTEPAKTMTSGEAAMQDSAQAGTPELVDGRLEYRKTAMPAPTPEMIPQAGPQVQLGRRPEDDQVYMPTATGRETDPQRMAAMLANPQYKAEFTPEQKRSLALEGMLASQNPMVQKIGQMQYEAMQPKQMDVSAVNLSDLTTNSAQKFARTRNPDDIEYRAPDVKPEAMSTFGRMIAERKAIFDKNPNDPRIVDYDRAINNETKSKGTTVNLPSSRDLQRDESGLRDQLQSRLKSMDWDGVKSAYQRIFTAPDTPVGDVAIVYAVAKADDPTGAVRQEDFDLRAKDGSLGGRIKSLYEEAKTGKMLPERRQQLIDTAY